MNAETTLVSTLVDALRSPGAGRLGLALLHFVWQGAAIAFLLLVARHLMRRRSASARYVVSCVALLLMAAAPIFTLATIDPPATRTHAAAPPRASIAPDPAPAHAPAVTHAASRDGGLAPGSRTRAAGAPVPIGVSTVVGLWILGVALLSLRLSTGLITVGRLTTRHVEPADESVARLLKLVAAQCAVDRPVRVLVSRALRAPVVVGWLRPVVLLPVSTVTGLGPAELRALLAHELAHVRRHDYAINLVQSVIETLLFYHPAIWWVSRTIRDERELACDDLAVAVVGDPIGYARTLLTLEEARTSPALPATGGSIAERVRRISGLPRAGANGSTRSVAGAILLASVTLGGIYLSASRAESRDVAPPTAASETAESAEEPEVEPVRTERERSEPEPASRRSAEARASISGGEFPARERVPESLTRAFESGLREQRWDGYAFSMMWASRGHRVRIECEGTFLLDERAGTIAWMEPASYLEIEERDRDGTVRRFEAERPRDGEISRTFFARHRGTRFESDESPEGAAWLASLIPHLVAAGADAHGRARATYEEGGIEAVLAALPALASDGTRATYLRYVIHEQKLTEEEIRAVREALVQELESDGTRADLLLTLHETTGEPLAVEEARETLTAIESDGTRAHVIIRLVEEELLTPGDALALVSLIDSDGTRAHVLGQLGELSKPEDLGSRVLEGIELIESDGTLAHLLLTMTESGALTRAEALEVAERRIDSDGTRVNLILNLLDARGSDEGPEIHDLLMRALRRTRSDGTLGHAVVQLYDLGHLDLVEALTLVNEEIRSDATRGNVAMQLCSAHGEGALTEPERVALMATLSEIESSHGLASTLIQLVDLEAVPVIDALALAGDRLRSSHTLRSFLMEIAPRVRSPEEVRAYLDAVDAIDSRRERRGLEELIER